MLGYCGSFFILCDFVPNYQIVEKSFCVLTPLVPVPLASRTTKQKQKKKTMTEAEQPMTFGVVNEEEVKVEGVMSDLAEAGLNELNNIAPESMKTYVQKAKNALAPATTLIEHQMPNILKAYDVISGWCRGASKYEPLQYTSLLVGLLMVFFGGTFGATIAAVRKIFYFFY